MKYKINVIEIKKDHACRHKHKIGGSFLFDKASKCLCKRNMKHFLALSKGFDESFVFTCPDMAVKFKVDLIEDSEDSEDKENCL